MKTTLLTFMIQVEFFVILKFQTKFVEKFKTYFIFSNLCNVM